MACGYGLNLGHALQKIPKDSRLLPSLVKWFDTCHAMDCHGYSYAEWRVRLNNSYSKDDLYLCPLCGLEFDAQLLDIACPYYSLLLKCPQVAE